MQTSSDEQAEMNDGTEQAIQSGVSTHHQSSSDERSAFGLKTSDRLFLATAAVICLCLMLINMWRRNTSGVETIEIRQLSENTYQFQIDINTATWVEWMQLENIGETTARNIIADLEENGPFQSIDDVQRVRGIGPKTLAGIRPHLRCADCE